MFSFKDGFVEALTRGMKAELLQAEDYSKLKQCDALSDLRLYLVV
jgi:vacuolar-type H+-ATPase subunit C/Vma6